MEDYPLYYYMMRVYPDVVLRSLGPVWRARVKKWLGKNSDLRDYVLTELKQKGPLLSRQFEDKTRAKPRGVRLVLLERRLPNALPSLLQRRSNGCGASRE